MDDAPLLLLTNEQYIARHGWRARLRHVRHALVPDGKIRLALHYLFLRSSRVAQPDE